MSFAIAALVRQGQAEEIRAEGRIPGVVYGPGMEPMSLSVAYADFDKLYKSAGESTLVDLTVDGQSPVKVLIQDIQVDLLKGLITHVDFRQINMNQELEVAVQIELLGVAPAVKEQGGALVQQLESVNVRCLPKDLINHIEVDVSVLKTFDDAIHVKDLQLPAGIEVLDEPEAVIATVSAPLSEEEIKAMEEAGSADLSAIEVEKKGKEDEAEEGEAKEAAPEEKA